MDYLISLDTNDFVRLSIKEVIKTLFEAIVLVVLVVYLFLQSFRTTIICTVAIFVALIATFAGMLALGFSINLLTLFGLVLAIGMVVDDAIVVVENVERNMAQHHLAPKEATIRSMERDRDLARRRRAGDVLGVHPRRVPARHHGPALQAVRDHDRDLGVGVGVHRADADAGDVRGAAQAQPAAAARLLRLVQPAGRPRDAGVRRRRDLRDQADGDRAGAARRFLYAIWHLFHILPTSFVPNEDQGYAMAAIIMPQAASLDRTQEIAEQADAIFKGIPGVATRTVITGYSLLDSGFKTNAGTFFVTFTDFDERYKNDRQGEEGERARDPRRFFAEAQEDRGRDRHPDCAAGDSGHRHHRRLRVLDPGHRHRRPGALDDVMQEFLAKARERPELTGLATTYRANSQQLRADVDRDKTSSSAFRSRTSTARSRRSSAR